MKQEIKKEKTKERIEYISQTIVCVLDSLDEFLAAAGLSDIEKMDVKTILVCEMTKELSTSETGMKNLIHIINDMKNSLRNLPDGETQGAMQ